MTQDVYEAKTKASDYKQRKQTADLTAAAREDEAEPKPRTEEEWHDMISRRIDEAMRNGAFDNLRGKGKPLNLERNPFVPEDQQLAFDLLKNNDLTPQWIGDRAAILRAIEKFKEEFRTTASQFHQAWQTTQHEQSRQNLAELWNRQLEYWQEAISDLNKQITTVNLQQPVAHLEIFKILLDDELMRIGMERTLA